MSSEETSVDDVWSACVTPNDGYEDGTEVCSGDLVVVSNDPPTISSVNITSSDNENISNGTLAGVYSYSDPDNDTETNNETQWYNGSVEVIDLQNFTSVHPDNTTEGENWTFSVRAYGGTAWSNWANSSTLNIRERICNNDSICEPSAGENYTNCPNDCEQGLVGYWSFDQTHRNSTHVYDLSGNNNDGLLDDITFSEGRSNDSAVFNGSGYIEITNSVELNVTNTTTIEAFIRKDADGAIVSSDDGNVYHGYRFEIESSKLNYGQANYAGATACEITSQAPIYDLWYHVVVTLNETDFKLYIDGSLDNHSTSGIPITYAPTIYHAIGRASVRVDHERFFYGKIDEVKIYNRTLDATEIEQNYLSYTCGDGVCDAGETNESCLSDCICGNNLCEWGETQLGCPSDCQPEYTHPYLFFNSSEIQALQHKAINGSINFFGFKLNETYASIKNTTDSYLGNYSYNVTHLCQNGSSDQVEFAYTLSNETPPNQTCGLCCPWTIISSALENRINYLAFVYPISGEDGYKDKLKDIILDVSSWDRWADPAEGVASLSTYSLTRAFSFAYDVLYDDLTSSEKQEIVTSLIEKGIKPSSFITLPDEPINNGDIGIIGARGMGILAVKGEDPYASDYNLEIVTNLTKNYTQNQDRDGGMYEGVSYGANAIDFFIKYAAPLKKLNIENLFELDFSKKVWNYPLYLTAFEKMVNFNDANTGLYWNNELAYAAGVLKINESAWYLKKQNFNFTDPFSFIFFDEGNIVFKEPGNASALFRDMGTAVLRYSWNGSFPVIFFKSGPESTIVSHAQYDQNTFNIILNSNWLIADAGYGQDYTYQHNTLLVDGEGQNNTFGGKISGFYDSTYFGCVKGNASEVYSNLTKFDRNIIYVMPDYFIIYDEIESLGEHNITWLIHSDALGNIILENGSFKVIQSDSIIRGNIFSNVVTTTGANEFLGITSTSQVSGTTYSKTLNVTTNPTTNVTFLSVLYPMNNSNPSLDNPSFEFPDTATASGWGDRGVGTYLIDSNNSYDGDKSQKISSNTLNEVGYIYQTIDVIPGSNYNFSVWAKTDNATNAYMVIWPTTPYPESQILTGSNNWTKLNISNVSFNSTTVDLVLRFAGPGAAWFDNVKIIDLNKSEKNISFTNLTSNAIEILYENDSLDIVSVNFSQGNKSFLSSKGTFECDGFACVVGVNTSDNNYTRFILHNGTELKLNDVTLFNSTVNAILSLKKINNNFDGDIYMDNNGTVTLDFPLLRSLTVNQTEFDDYQYDYQKIIFNLSQGQNRILLSGATCGDNLCSIGENITNCQVDCDKDKDNMDDRSDPLVGNESHVNNNLDNLTLEVNSSTNITQNFTQRINVKFKENGTTRLEFNFNFSREQLNLSNLNVTKQSSTDTAGSLEISGLDLTSQGENKTLYIDRLNNYHKLCIKDIASARVSNISTSCNEANETPINCNGTAGQYRCIINGSYYQLEGLNHSAVKEYSISTPVSGGGGSSGIPLICTPGTIQCINSLHYKECLDYGTTNKWSNTLDVPEGYKCEFGEIVELEEVVEEVVEVIEVPEEIFEKAEELPAKVSVWKTFSSKIKEATSTLVGRIGESIKSTGKWFSQTYKRTKQLLTNLKLWLIPIITTIVVTVIILYQLRKKPNKKVRKKKSNKKPAKALTKFIINCKKKGIPKTKIKKSLLNKGWPKKIINEYMKEVF